MPMTPLGKEALMEKRHQFWERQPSEAARNSALGLPGGPVVKTSLPLQGVRGLIPG